MDGVQTRCQQDGILLNKLSPCGPDGPAHHHPKPSPDGTTSSSEALPLFSSKAATPTTSAPGTMLESSPSALADALGSMSLSPVATVSPQLSIIDHGVPVAAETSILAESVLPINPALSPSLPAASVNIQSISPASLQDNEVPMISTIAGGTPPLGPSLVWDNGPAASSQSQANPPALSQLQQVMPAAATGAEAVSAYPSSQVLAPASAAEIPGSLQVPKEMLPLSTICNNYEPPRITTNTRGYTICFNVR